MRSLVILLGAALVLVAAPASAVPVDITYNIQVTVNIPAFGVFPAFSGPGTQTIRFYNGTSGGHVSYGPLKILSGTASLAGAFFIGPNFFSGTQMFVNLGTGMGTAPSTSFFLTTSAHVTQGFIHCSGPQCFSFGFTPSMAQPLTSYFNFFSQQGTIFGFPSGGPQSFSGQGSAGTFGSAQLTAVITGQEVSRVVVPEPGTGLLVGLGLAGLGVAGPVVRRVRRRGSR